MPNRKIKAVLFDLGDTLLNFGRIKRIKLLKESARLTYDFLATHHQEKKVGSFRFYCWRSFFSLYLRIFLSTLTGDDFDALALLKRLGSQLGLKLDDLQWDQMGWLWYEPLTKSVTIEPDLGETLGKLKGMNLKLGVLSNTFVNKMALERHLRQLGILDYFDARLYSYEYKFRKPDPRIFLYAVDSLGVRLPETVFVGDRLDKDIKPALDLEMIAVCKKAYTNKGKKVPQNAYKIDLISELPPLIEKIKEQIN